MSQYFELVTYTASPRIYSDPVIGMYKTKKNYFNHSSIYDKKNNH